MPAARQPGPALFSFVLTIFGCLLVVGVVTSAAVVAQATLDGVSMQALSQDPEAGLTAGLMGFSALLQGGLLGLAAVGLAYGFSEQRWSDIREVLGLEHPGWWGFSLAAAAGALTVGLLPGWVAAQIYALLPELAGTLTLLTERMATGSTGGRTVLVLAVCIAAPLGEELAFRGFLWHHLEGVMPGWAVWIATSLLFAAYHLDPVQSPALVPTALFLGWLRWQSGSLIPALLAHGVNNVLATVALLTPTGDEPFVIPLSVALTGALATCLSCAAASHARPRS